MTIKDLSFILLSFVNCACDFIEHVMSNYVITNSVTNYQTSVSTGSLYKFRVRRDGVIFGLFAARLAIGMVANLFLSALENLDLTGLTWIG
jgi:hypothetical protein